MSLQAHADNAIGSAGSQASPNKHMGVHNGVNHFTMVAKLPPIFKYCIFGSLTH